MTIEDFATEAELKYLKAVEKHGSIRAAARALNLHKSTIGKAIKRAQARAASRGVSPVEDANGTAPEGYHVKGKSTLYGRDGKPVAQWVKTAKDPAEDRRKALADAFAAMADEYRGAAKLVKPPSIKADETLAAYLMGDPHIGLLAWHKDAGDDHNLEIGTRELYGSVDNLVSRAPFASTAWLVNVGDFFHSDNQSNMTARSGHVLDVDTRWTKIIQAGVAVMRHAIQRLLEKHSTVHVTNEIGNHDDHTAFVLSIMLAAYFENEPRVTVDTSPATFHFFRFGKNLFGTTHGNNVKPVDLPGIMAAQRPQDWGETDWHHWFTGHIHHKTVHEFRGTTVESLRTLVPADSWHASKGYMSRREMQCVTYHREFGELERTTVNTAMLRSLTKQPA